MIRDKLKDEIAAHIFDMQRQGLPPSSIASLIVDDIFVREVAIANKRAVDYAFTLKGDNLRLESALAHIRSTGDIGARLVSAALTVAGREP